MFLLFFFLFSRYLTALTCELFLLLVVIKCEGSPRRLTASNTPPEKRITHVHVWTHMQPHTQSAQTHFLCTCVRGYTHSNNVHCHAKKKKSQKLTTAGPQTHRREQGFFHRGAGFCVNEQRESPSSSAPLSPKSYHVPPFVSHTPVSKLPAASAANLA